MRVALIVPLFVALFSGGSPALADEAAGGQGPAELRVTVQDQTGAALITASVTLTDSAGVPRQSPVDERGVAVIAGVAPGTWTLRVEAEAFETYDDSLSLKRGDNAIVVQLPLAGLNEQVVVSENLEDLRGNSFSRTLSEHEIAELPDDPDELEQMLMQMAGPGATMTVNGFRGGRLPPKSQIRSIRFRMNSFAAENHEAGGFRIDIQTKPGSTDWRGMTNLGFRNDAMNARNAFAEERGPEQYRRFGFNVDGPLRKGTTSVAFSTDGNLSYDSQTMVAGPGQLSGDQVRQPFEELNTNARLEHALTGTQTLMVEYQRRDEERRNLGVGDFDLLSRAYTRQNERNIVRGALNGLVAPRVANELKVQVTSQQTDVFSTSDEPAIVVVDEFSIGGAGQQSDRRVRELEIANNMDFSFHKRHAVRMGVQLEAAWYHSRELRNGNGAFTFASQEAFELGVPTTYRQRVGDMPVEFSQYQLGVYLQDDITLSKALTVSLGVRHELQNTLADRLNVAPRVGFTWSPSKWTFRGGWGIFNDWYESSVYEQTLRLNGLNQQEIVVLQPGFPDPYEGALADVLPPSVIRAATDGLKMPWLHQASFGAERTFGDVRVQTSYMMQRGRNQLRSRNANAPIDGLERPEPALGNVTEFESTGRLSLDRLQIGVNLAKPQRRLFLGVNYMLSRLLNHADSAVSLPADNYDLDAEWGHSSQDARHRLFVMAGFGLPLKLRVFTNSQFMSALPYNVITGFDDNNDSVTNDRPEGTARNAARGAASWNINARLSRAFSFGPPQTTDGPEGGPQIRGGRGGGRGGPRGGGPMMMLEPGAKRYQVEFYAQVYNLLNRVNYTSFTGSQRSQYFGQPVAAGPARRLELGMMFRF